MFFYSTTYDQKTGIGTTLTHTELYQRDGLDTVDYYFERPNGEGFDFLRGRLPEISVTHSYGFSEQEIMKLKGYLKNNLFLIWDFSQKGGGENA